MPAPTIDTLPTPPNRTDAPAQFNARADALLGALPGFVTQTNAVAAYVEGVADGLDEDVLAAETAATNAGVSETNAEAAAGEAEAARDEAVAAAAQAAEFVGYQVGAGWSNSGLNLVADDAPVVYARASKTGTIVRAVVLADAAGSCVIDTWKDTFANYPPTVADTITASAKPTLSSANKVEDTTLTGWTTAVTAGDVFGFKLESASAIKYLQIILEIE